MAVPSINALPVVTGTARAGETLTSSTGLWLGVPILYTYQWFREDGNITGATTSTHLVASDDILHYLACRVTATNASGSASAESVLTERVTGEEDIFARVSGAWYPANRAVRVSGEWV